MTLNEIVCADCQLTQDELSEKRKLFAAQRKELFAQVKVWVTCICGRKLVLSQAFRCWFCGLTLCSFCAEAHFGPKPPFAKVGDILR